MHIELENGKPNRYETEELALARVRTLLRAAGVWTGVRPCGDGTYSLLYDPWARRDGQRDDGELDNGGWNDGEQDDAAGSDLQLHRLPPGDGHAGADLPVGAAVGEAAE